MISSILDIFEEFWWLGIFSITTFFLTIMILPLVIVRLPADYFACEKADGFISRQSRGLRSTLLVLKNLAGIFLLSMGFLMLFVPGQGFLTILAGLSVMNFPGKRKLEIKLVSSDKIFKSLNWIRLKGKKELFQKPDKLIQSQQ